MKMVVADDKRGERRRQRDLKEAEREGGGETGRSGRREKA